MSDKLEMDAYLDALLDDNWSQYDEIKIRHNQNVMTIDSSQRWELNFIEELLYKHFPYQDKNRITILVYLYFKHHIEKVERRKFLTDIINRILLPD